MTKAEYDEKTKEALYNPFNDAWKLAMGLKNSDLTQQKTWDEYVAKVDVFAKDHGNTELAHTLQRALYDVGTELNRITGGDYKLE